MNQLKNGKQSSSVGDTESIVIGNTTAEDQLDYINIDDTRSIKSYKSMQSQINGRVSYAPSTDNLPLMTRNSTTLQDDPKPILKSNKTVNPSYHLKQALDSIKIMNARTEIQDVNKRYNRTRRYDTAGKYRIGPTFITKSRLSYLDAHKPAKLSVVPDPSFKSLEFGLLTYLWTFTDQHDKTQIDLAFIQSLIDSGVDINCTDEHGQTALHAMVRDWHPDVVLFAVRNNANVNAADKMGRSPLHLAAAINSVEIANILCKHGAKVDLPTYAEKQTPMHFAAKYNSLDTMKLLIKYQGSITQRDSQNRTVLFIAAEQGGTETAQFLLDIGAPAGIYDTHGISAISYLLEKMPHVAYRALQQFVSPNMSLKQSEMYLKYLETNAKGKTAMIQKSPLEMITVYDDTELIMHPVIQKVIEVKWKLFGRMDTIRKLFITLIYLVCWLTLAYTFRDDNTYYRPFSQQGWKIAFEVLIVAFAIFFFYKDVRLKRDAVRYHTQWAEWKQQMIRSNYVHCHPSWPGDRENLEAETERIRAVPSLVSKQKSWFVYECFMLIVLAAIIVTRILTMSFSSKSLFIVHKCIFGAGLIFSFLRILKIIVRFQFFAVFLKISSLVLTTAVQVLLLYVQVYIPFVSIFWLAFGNNELKSEIENIDLSTLDSHWSHVKNHSGILTSLDNMFFNVYSTSFGQGFLDDLLELRTTEAQILTTLYHILVTFILFSVFIALITSKFTTQYSRVVAEASLLRASVVLQLEKNLNKKDKMKLAKYYKHHCNPLIVPFEAYTETILKRNALSQLRLAERRLTGIENIVNQAEARFIENDSKTHQVVMENINARIGILQEEAESFGKGLSSNLKELLQKQEYMNRYLPKLLKLAS